MAIHGWLAAGRRSAVEALSFGHLRPSPQCEGRGLFSEKRVYGREAPPARTEEGITTSQWPAEKSESP